MKGLARLNALSSDEATSAFIACCGSSRWAASMLKKLPFNSEAELYRQADSVWGQLTSVDWLEAFSHHPRIGDASQLPKNTTSTRWALEEQSGAAAATEATLSQLARHNEEYYRKFGFIFLICATGKTASEMLRDLRIRIGNTRKDELRIAAAEQAKITRLRLEKLLAS